MQLRVGALFRGAVKRLNLYQQYEVVAYHMILFLEQMGVTLQL